MGDGGQPQRDLPGQPGRGEPGRLTPVTRRPTTTHAPFKRDRPRGKNQGQIQDFQGWIEKY